MLKTKILIGLMLGTASVSAIAVPNVWQSGYAQGFSEYSIHDSKGNALWISCNEGAGDNFDHSVTFKLKNKDIENTDAKYPLSFLLDGKKSVSPPGTTRWRNGANAWSDFATGIAKAKKIEVFVNNKKVTAFQPTASSIKSVAKDIGSCDALW